MRKLFILIIIIGMLPFSSIAFAELCISNYNADIRVSPSIDSEIISVLNADEIFSISSNDINNKWIKYKNGYAEEKLFICISNNDRDMLLQVQEKRNKIFAAKEEKRKEIAALKEVKKQQIATAKEAKQKLIEEKKQQIATIKAQKQENNWKIKEFVNNFKEPTGKKYVRIEDLNGSFSNYTDSNADCPTELIVTSTGKVGIFLHEYSRRAPSYFIGDTRVQMKNSKGELFGSMLYKWNHNGGVSVRHRKECIQFLKRNVGIIKVYIEAPGSLSYNFSFNSDGFAIAYDKIKINKSETARFHIVRKDETLYSISKRYGLSVNQLMELNNLNEGCILSIKQVLGLK